MLQRRREPGHYAPFTGRHGRKPFCVGPLRQRFKTLLVAQPDVTLVELRDRTGVPCTLAAIGKILHRLGYRRKKKTLQASKPNFGLKTRILRGMADINAAPVVHRWKKFDFFFS